ncbi:DNA-binding protein WhiA [Butyrivibrio sp. MB2005]|uniref:DNA-binding protein WhiA n=1 Tax=Butyrivibrio sp. MB2005 TaxID=1280678 RepID=UPI0004293664|nr:DNA-binding protein WhiA [Butyrivibrio sp. MB2005]
MSFSGDVKNELEKQVAPGRHCQLAEIAAILINVGYVERKADDEYRVFLADDSERAIRKFFTLLKKAFNIDTGTLQDGSKEIIGGKVYRLVLSGSEKPKALLKGIHYFNDDGSLRDENSGINHQLIMKACCKRAFLRDSFLCIGSISDPSKSYHLEFSCGSLKLAEELRTMIESFDIEAKIIQRKKYHVVYIKESTSIVDLLNVMEAPVSLMNMENERIVKEMRGAINRRVNCETANITKTVNAASRQTTDILYLRDHYGFENLPESLRDMAEARLQYPDATLLELGKYLDPPVGKSGVNHRLRKLSELAEKLRG